MIMLKSQIFKQDVEEAVNLRSVTSGSLKTSRHEFDPESGHIKIFLTIKDPRWQPEEIDNWDSASRTFVEVSKKRRLTT